MKRLSLVLVFGVLAVASHASAAILISHPDDFFVLGETTRMKLENFENEVNVAGGTVGIIEPGDRLRGIFQIISSNQQGGGVATERFPVGFELTGIFDIEVASVDPLGGGAALFEFVPYAPFAAEFSLAAGAMIAFYHDTTPDFTALGTVAGSETAATNGSLYMSLGANDDWGDVDADGDGYYWAANGQISPGVATFAASLALLDNFTGYTLSDFQDITQAPPLSAGGSFTNEAALDDILNEFALQGNTSPNTVPASPYAVFSQDPLRAHVIPEPASVLAWLLLLSSTGAAVAIRRRRN